MYLADMADFAEMNEAYIAVGISPSALRPFSMFAPGGADRQYIPKPPPSRSCLEAKPPGGMRIEIECIAQA